MKTIPLPFSVEFWVKMTSAERAAGRDWSLTKIMLTDARLSGSKFMETPNIGRAVRQEAANNEVQKN